MDARCRPWKVLCLESDEGRQWGCAVFASGARQGRGGASRSRIRKVSRRRERLREKGVIEREGSVRGDGVRITIRRPRLHVSNGGPSLSHDTSRGTSFGRFNAPSCGTEGVSSKPHPMIHAVSV
jgi:hypothetical protein